MKPLCSEVINHRNELKSYINVNVIGIMGNYQWEKNKLEAVYRLSIKLVMGSHYYFKSISFTCFRFQYFFQIYKTPVESSTLCCLFLKIYMMLQEISIDCASELISECVLSDTIVV